MDFLNWIYSPQETIKVNGKTLVEGDIVNLFGEDYTGKTKMCYDIIENNIEKAVLYIDTENSMYPRLEELGKKTAILYSNFNKMSDIKKIILTSIVPIDYVIIDSLTAVELEKYSTDLLDLFNVIKKNNKNLILVSQVRSYKDQVSYGFKKLLNFYAYNFEIK